MSLEDMLKKAGSNIKKAILIPMIAVASMMPMKGEGAGVIQYGDAAQGPVNTTFIMDLMNNNVGTVYQSATINLDAILGDVADYISQHSSDTNFAGKSRSEIYGKFFFVPGGEVSTGWSATFNGSNTVNITHINGIPGLQYTTWQSPSYNNGIQDTMTLYCTVPNSALNGKNMTTSGSKTNNIFAATTTGGAIAYTSSYPYQLKPEPTTINGIPYTWLTQYGLSTNNAVETVDNDGDGINNLSEYIADTNPTNSSSKFYIMDFKGGSNPSLTIPGSSTGRVYTVLSSTNLMTDNFSTIETNFYGNGSNKIVNLKPINDKQKYYKTNVSLP